MTYTIIKHNKEPGTLSFEIREANHGQRTVAWVLKREDALALLRAEEKRNHSVYITDN